MVSIRISPMIPTKSPAAVFASFLLYLGILSLYQPNEIPTQGNSIFQVMSALKLSLIIIYTGQSLDTLM